MWRTYEIPVAAHVGQRLRVAIVGSSNMFGADLEIDHLRFAIGSDHDTASDATDNCLTIANTGQADADGDGRGDACDSCRQLASPDQTDGDGDGAGDVCPATSATTVRRSRTPARPTPTTTGSATRATCPTTIAATTTTASTVTAAAARPRPAARQRSSGLRPSSSSCGAAGGRGRVRERVVHEAGARRDDPADPGRWGVTMHRRAWSAIATAMLIGACGHAAPSRAPGSQVTAAPPQAVIAALARYEQPNASLIVGRLFPIGWSADGRFAYAYEPPDEACGCYTLEVVVRDLRTGDVVWQDRHESGELREGDPDQLRTIDDVWRVRGEDYRRHLRDHGIDEVAGHELEPLATGGVDVPRVEIDRTSVGDDSDVGFAHLTAYRIDAVTSGGRTTLLASRAEGIGPLDVEVAGSLPPSASSSMAAVVIVERWRGWEGTPHVAQLRLAGAVLGPR